MELYDRVKGKEVFFTEICYIVLYKLLFDIILSTDGYNNYAKQIKGMIGGGACAAVRQENQIHFFRDDTCILHFLSGEITPKFANFFANSVIQPIA